jgi:serine protease inhibitor
MKLLNFSLSGAFLLTISIVSVSCKKESAVPLPVDPVPINLSANQISLISNENSFAIDIFKNILGKSPDNQNIMISPLSISTALSMTLNGSEGATRDAMLATLKLNGLTPASINSSYKDLTSALLGVDQRVLISIANSVWIENNFVVKKPFTDILTQYYTAEAKSFDVTDPKVPQLVNSWIESKTNGLIKNMLGTLDQKTVMLLINAIYFKGKWNSQFDKTKTLQESFYKQDGTSEQVPMMKQTSDFKIYNGDGFSMAEFPYGQGNFVMDVLLPDSKNGIGNLVSSVNLTNIQQWLNSMSKRSVELSFPKFKYGFKMELKDVLSGMGMTVAFSDAADFSDISDLPTKISFVLHQAFIETDEEGTEAAAATIVGIGITSMPIGPAEFKVDHPFLYMIRETTTNTILFMGKVTDPLAN